MFIWEISQTECSTNKKCKNFFTCRQMKNMQLTLYSLYPVPRRNSLVLSMFLLRIRLVQYLGMQMTVLKNVKL